MLPYYLSVLGNIIVLFSVSNLLGTDTFVVIVVGVGVAVSGQGGELSAVFPSQVGIELLTFSVSGGIANSIIYRIMGGIPIGYRS